MSKTLQREAEKQEAMTHRGPASSKGLSLQETDPLFDEDDIADVLPTDPDEALRVVQAGVDELAPQGERTGALSGYGRPINDIIKDLSKPLPKVWLFLVDKGVGRKLTAYAWFRVLQAFDKYAPGWSNSLTQIHYADDHWVVGMKMCIPAREGLICREDVGAAYENPDAKKRNKGFDPVLKAKQQALKRTAAQFGFGMYLYDVERE